MPQLTPAQARIIDPVLSTHALGYSLPNLIARQLFPLAPVAMYGGQVIEFGKEAFKLYNSKRAPGTETKRIRFGYEGKPYAIVPSALEAPVPRELQQDASHVPGIDLGVRAVNMVLRNLHLEHEYNSAQLARNASNYDTNHKLALTGTSTWTGAASNPVADVSEAREAIRASTGVYPNTIEISATAFAALQSNTSILDRIKYTGRDSVTTAILANLFQIPNVLIGVSMTADASDTFGDVWGDDVILANTNVSASLNVEEPSYGYTYVIQGHPLVEKPYWEERSKAWIYGVSFDNQPVLSGITSGFLITGAGTKQ